MGRVLVDRNPRTQQYSQPVRGALPVVMEIAEFSNTLKKGEVRAVDVASDQVEIERAPFGSATSSAMRFRLQHL